MNRHINLPPTKEGEKLLAAFEKRGICANAIPEVVYEKTDDGDGYVFKGAFDNEADYGDDCIIVPVTSTYKGKETWKGGQEFANVLKSSNDHGTYKEKACGWKEIYKAEDLTWERYENTEFYDCYDGSRLTDHRYTCDGLIPLGGHVIKGREPKKLIAGSDVYIVPICHHHNSYNVPHGVPNTTPNNGNGFFMTLQGNPTDEKEILVMTGYVPMRVVKDYIK